jgi:hypothetical protein
MKNVVEIKNVKNVVTEDIGTLYLIASIDKEAKQNNNVIHQGLAIFFKPEGEISPTYVKSFIFTDLEAKLMRRGKMQTVRDIGYFLDVQNLTMDIMCLESGMDNRISNDNMFGTQKITRTVFSLEYTDLGYDHLLVGANDNRHNMCGFRLAVSQAFNSMVNITDDSIVPCTFPEEANVVEFDYKV